MSPPTLPNPGCTSEQSLMAEKSSIDRKVDHGNPVAWEQHYSRMRGNIEDMAGTAPSQIFTSAVEQSVKKGDKERKRKADESVKQQRRERKYLRNSDTAEARKAYSRHDGGISPDDVHNDISAEHLENLKTSYYETKVVVTAEDANKIETGTCDQSESEQWITERRKRLTASIAGGIAKMRATTSKSKKVENLLYSKFKGNAATRYGSCMEDTTVKEYETYQHQHGHPNLKVNGCGLFISLNDPWLAATPDGIVDDPSDDVTQTLGLLEIKNPYSLCDQSLEEAVSKQKSFCLEKNTYKLKQRHDYYYQIQIQLYCTDRLWCDFVLRTDKELHVERIYRNEVWLDTILPKLRTFYFSALLPELACPRHHQGGIRQ